MIQRNETFSDGNVVTTAEVIDTTAQTVTFQPSLQVPRVDIQGAPVLDGEGNQIIDTVASRPFNADEVTYWAGYEAALSARANEAALRQSPQARIDGMIASIEALKTAIGTNTDPAGTTSLQALRNQTNANVVLAPSIKALIGLVIDVARESRKLGRSSVALARLDLEVLDSSSTGTE